MNDIRKACVRTVFDEFDDHGDVIRPTVDVETLLMPPAPPRDTVIMFGLTGYAIRVTGKGASLMELDVNGSHELASIGKDQARKFIQSIGGAR